MTELRLDRDRVTTTTYPEQLREAVEEATRAWKAFCELPDEIKQLFAIDNTQFGVGYEKKSGKGESADIKENFDFSASGQDRLISLMKEIDDPAVTAFITALSGLLVAARPKITELGKTIESTYDIKGYDKILDTDSSPYFRFLHYPSGGQPGDIIAEPHCDHGGLTLHLGESTGGCEYLTSDGTWLPLPVADGEAVVFGGMQTQLVSGGHIEALCHRVIASETTASVGRYAIVCFNLFSQVPKYDRPRHGRLQEMPAGFNYGHDQATFADYFVKS